METICCVCDESVKSPYSYFHHVDDKVLRIYNGHKRCLFAIPRLIEEGKEMEYSEINKGNFRKKAKTLL